MKEMVNKSGLKLISRITNYKFLCECPSCGNRFEKWGSEFYRGSHGCECTKTNWMSERLYSVYRNIKTRCNNPNSDSYNDYGGRGIKLCDEWDEHYPTFRKWALDNGYSEELSIDRIDNDGNYTPENCKWSTSIEQNNNKRNNINITVDGITQSMRRWCIESGLNYKSEHAYYRKHNNDLSRLQNKLEEIHK